MKEGWSDPNLSITRGEGPITRGENPAATAGGAAQTVTLAGEHHLRGFVRDGTVATPATQSQDVVGYAKITSITVKAASGAETAVPLGGEPVYARTGADILEPFIMLARSNVHVDAVTVAMECRDMSKAYDADKNPRVPTWHVGVLQPLEYTDSDGKPATGMMEDEFAAPVVNPGRIAFLEDTSDGSWYEAALGSTSNAFKAIKESIDAMCMKGLRFVPDASGKIVSDRAEFPDPFYPTDPSKTRVGYSMAAEYVDATGTIRTHQVRYSRAFGGGPWTFSADVQLQQPPPATSTTHVLISVYASRLATRLARFHDGATTLGLDLVPLAARAPAGTPGGGWSAPSFAWTGIAVHLRSYIPHLLGTCTLERAGVALDSRGGGTGPLRVELPVILDLESGAVTIAHRLTKNAPKIVPAMFGQKLRQAVDAAADRGASWLVDDVTLDTEGKPVTGTPDEPTQAELYKLTLVERVPAGVNPARVTLRFGSGAMTNYKEISGWYSVGWAIDGRGAGAIPRGDDKVRDPNDARLIDGRMLGPVLDMVRETRAWLDAYDNAPGGPRYKIVNSAPTALEHEEWAGLALEGPKPFGQDVDTAKFYIAISTREAVAGGDGGLVLDWAWYKVNNANYGDEHKYATVPLALDQILIAK